MIFFSWIAASNFGWRESGTSPISSRKRVPPSARWKSPFRSPEAPVKEPRVNPNSSDSNRVSGMAEQLISISGRFRLGPL